MNTTRPSTTWASSDTARPASTATREIGSARKRSMIPVCTSSAMPTAIPMIGPNMPWANMPAIRYSR